MDYAVSTISSPGTRFPRKRLPTGLSSPSREAISRCSRFASFQDFNNDLCSHASVSVFLLGFRREEYLVTSYQVLGFQNASIYVLTRSSALYMLLMEHFDSVAEKIQSCMEGCVTVAKSFGEVASSKVGGAQVFGSLTVVLLQ